MKIYKHLLIYAVLIFAAVGCHSQQEVVRDQGPEWTFATKLLKSLQNKNDQNKLQEVKPFYADLWPKYVEYVDGNQDATPKVKDFHKFKKFVEAIVPNYSFCGSCQELQRKYVSRQKFILGEKKDCKECSREAKAHGHPDLPKIFAWNKQAYQQSCSLLERNIQRAGLSPQSCEIQNVYSKKLKSRNNIDYLQIVVVLSDANKNPENRFQLSINAIRSDFGINLLEHK